MTIAEKNLAFAKLTSLEEKNAFAKANPDFVLNHIKAAAMSAALHSREQDLASVAIMLTQLVEYLTSRVEKLETLLRGPAQ